MRELPDGGREFVLDDPELRAVSVDGAAHLCFGALDVALSAPGVILRNGYLEHFCPGDTHTLTGLLDLYPATVQWAWSTVTGRLVIVFVDETRLSVPRAPTTRAWSVGSVYCLAGNEEPEL